MMTLLPKLQLLYCMTIAMTGLIGNVTTIIVFSQRRLRSLRSSFFLTCLAITDLIFILILIIALLDDLYVPIMTKPVCILTIYLSHIASFLSSTFTLAYTTHRLIAVLFPIKSTTCLKQRTNRILTIGLLIFACSFYSLSFPVTSTKFRSNTTATVYCEEDRNNPLLFPFLLLDTLFTFLIPFSLITLMNVTIVYKLQTKIVFLEKYPISKSPSLFTNPSGNISIHSINESYLHSQSLVINSNSMKKEINRLLSSQKTDQTPLRNRSIQQYHGLSRRTLPVSQTNTSTSTHIRSNQCRASTSAKTTKMLLAASTAFLVFNLPYHSLLFCFLFIENTPSWMLGAVNIARLWFFASFCMNFFIYTICGQRFRSEVVRLFSCFSVRHYFQSQTQRKLMERQNSIYLSRRLLPSPLIRSSD